MITRYRKAQPAAPTFLLAPSSDGSVDFSQSQPAKGKSGFRCTKYQNRSICMLIRSDTKHKMFGPRNPLKSRCVNSCRDYLLFSIPLCQNAYLGSTPAAKRYEFSWIETGYSRRNAKTFAELAALADKNRRVVMGFGKVRDGVKKNAGSATGFAGCLPSQRVPGCSSGPARRSGSSFGVSKLSFALYSRDESI